jgi:two-component system nitrogen regulation response regulator GlnG
VLGGAYLVGLVGESTEMAAVLEQIEEAASSDAPILIDGEPGTGRELVARTIHYAGPRRGCDFVAVKATAIPRAVLEGELFGPRATTLRRANGGTLLLKDVDALPRGPQKGLAKILRRRERDETSGEAVDVRIIGASDGDLGDAVESQGFDRELYDRLGVRIHIPPLRRRLADLPKLVRRFVGKASEELGRTRPSIHDSAFDRMARYPWPGNVAELKDVARRLVQGWKGRGKKGSIDAQAVDAVLPKVAERIPLEDMSFEELVLSKLRGFLRRVDGYPLDNLYDEVITRVERPLLTLVMEHAQGSQLKAAEILGLNRNTLRKKLAEHNLGGAPAKRGRGAN